MRPAMARRRVVFPAPLGPRAIVSPGPISTETPRTTGRSSRTTVASWSDAEGSTRRHSRRGGGRHVVRGRAAGDRPGRARAAGLPRDGLRLLPRAAAGEPVPAGGTAAGPYRNGRSDPPAGAFGRGIPPPVDRRPRRVRRTWVPRLHAPRAARPAFQCASGRSRPVPLDVTVKMAPNDAAVDPVTPVGQDEDRELAVRASGGDVSAFGLLYDRHVATIYRYVYYRVRDDAEAEDLTSDVFMRALKAMPRYEPRQAFLAWLYRIARNAVIDRARRGKRQVSFEDALDHPAADQIVEPDVELLSRSDSDTLRKALAKLTPLQQEVIVLR